MYIYIYFFLCFCNFIFEKTTTQQHHTCARKVTYSWRGHVTCDLEWHLLLNLLSGEYIEMWFIWM